MRNQKGKMKYIYLRNKSNHLSYSWQNYCWISIFHGQVNIILILLSCPHYRKSTVSELPQAPFSTVILLQTSSFAVWLFIALTTKEWPLLGYIFFFIQEVICLPSRSKKYPNVFDVLNLNCHMAPKYDPCTSEHPKDYNSQSTAFSAKTC